MTENLENEIPGVGIENAAGAPAAVDAAASAAKAAEEAMLAEFGVDGEKSAVRAKDETPGADAFPDLSGVAMATPMAHPAEFQPISPSPGTQDFHNNIDMLLDVKMPVSIELGRTELPIAELLTLGPGSVIELNKLSGEPVDLLVNNKIIARGEVVVVAENFGIRVTSLVSPEERIKSLATE